MRTTLIAGLTASLIATAVAAATTTTPAWADPVSDVQELQQQVSDLHDNWDTLTPQQRSQRLAQLQSLVTTVDQETRDLPPDQKAAVEGPLIPATFELAQLFGKAHSSAGQPCVPFISPPPCGF